MKRFWPWASGRRRDDLQEELESHLRMATADRVAGGESQKAARHAAMREFGNVPLIQDETRKIWGLVWFDELLLDIRYALRQLRRSPAFALTVIGTLGLGIAASTAMFAVVDHVLLRPVAYRNPDRIVVILEGSSKEAKGSSLAPWLDIQEWRNRSRSFQQIAFWGRLGGRNYLEQKTSALPIDGIRVSPNLFQTLGVKPFLGRGFLPSSSGSAAEANPETVVLSYSVWKATFGGDLRILGRVVTINNAPVTVVGVMPRGFAFPWGYSGRGQVWISVGLGKVDQTRSLDAWSFEAIGRLRKGQSLASARSEMQEIQKSIAPEYTNPQSRAEHGTVSLQRYESTLVASDLTNALWALLGASAVVWLIASFNVTNLCLARNTARQREIAMRRALGASRWRVMQQMIVESLALSALATLFGVSLAAASLTILAHALRSRLPIPVPTRPDDFIVLALLGLTLLSALISGAWPTLLAVNAPIEPILKRGGALAGMGRRQHRMQAALVTLELALSLALLVSCGLLLRTLYTLRRVPMGFRFHHVVVAHLDIPSFRFAGTDMTRVLYEPLLERVEQSRGIRAAGLMTEVPLGQTFAPKITLRMFGKATPTYLKAVSPGVQKVFGFRMAAGRFFNPQDTPHPQIAVVVNQAFARLYSPDSHDPAEIVGKKLFSSNRDSKGGESAIVVGVLSDERQQKVDNPAQPEIDICISQITPTSMFYQPLEGVTMDLPVRTDEPPAGIIPELRAILRHASPELATANLTTMDQIVEDSYGNQRFAAHLLEIFGGLALLLCVSGLYGLMSYVVAQRTREIGLRIALGAAPGDLLWMILSEAGAMLLAGAAGGAALAFASARLVSSYLYGVSAHDASTMACALTVLFVTGMLAAYVPARRAAGIDPMEALRSE